MSKTPAKASTSKAMMPTTPPPQRRNVMEDPLDDASITAPFRGFRSFRSQEDLSTVGRYAPTAPPFEWMKEYAMELKGLKEDLANVKKSTLTAPLERNDDDHDQPLLVSSEDEEEDALIYDVRRQQGGQQMNLTPNLRLPNVKAFVPSADLYENTMNLETWFERFDQYCLFFQLYDPLRQRTAALLVGGDHIVNAWKFGVRIYPDNVGPTSPKKTLQDLAYVIFKLTVTRHLTTVEVSLIFFRYKFLREQQLRDEGIGEYYLRLRQRASFCDFGDNIDQRIYEMLLVGCRNNALRLKAFQERFDLKEFLTYSQGLESAQKQNNAMKTPGNSNLTSVNAISKKNKKKSFGKKTTPKKPTPSDPCGKCGYEKHTAGQLCPAKGSECRSCGLTGHFSAVCRQRDQQSKKNGNSQPRQGQRHGNGQKNKKKGVNQVTYHEDSSDDNDEHTVNAITKHVIGNRG